MFIASPWQQVHVRTSRFYHMFHQQLEFPVRLTEVWTSRFWTWLSNLSMTAETFCRSMEPRALSRALVTWPILLVTWGQRDGSLLHLSHKWRKLTCQQVVQTEAHPLHGDRRLDLGGHGVHSWRHTQPVQTFILFPDGVFSINSGTVHVLLLQSLSETRPSDTALCWQMGCSNNMEMN